MEVSTPAGAPMIPGDLSELAHAEWNLVLPDLDLLGVLAKTDGALLAGYCQVRAQWKIAYADVEKNGQLCKEPIRSRRGEVVGHKLKVNPSFLNWIELDKAKQRYETEFGLTPSARTRLRIKPPPQEPDPLETYLAKKYNL